MTLALSDKMPSKIYDEAISGEISRLESVGESLIEHLFYVSATTNPENYDLSEKDLEDLTI